MAYRVKLRTFEGPLDLLLFLIKKEEVDIYDIPIAEITRQYLEYLDILTMLDLEGAGDFILVAATLIRIKAQLLLPRNPEEQEEEEEDPRQELVRRLLEYQQYKEVALQLGQFEFRERDFFGLGYRDYDFSDEPPDYSELSGQVSLFDLMAAFKRVLMRVPKEGQHRIEQIPVTVEDQIDYILQELQVSHQLLFVALLQKLPSKVYIIVTFLALLEMMRRGAISATQSSPFGEIWIQKN
jgi:segregation and condensation protein A